MQYAAVRLFVERAAAVHPGFRLASGAEAAAVGLICRRLDGIPLALELAAARASMLTVDEIARRLDDGTGIGFLARGRHAGPARHQTLRAAVDWSYGLLSPEEKDLFIQLSVFAGGFELAAAEGVADGTSGDVLSILTRLVDKSLVVAEPGAARQTRYRMLDTIREYAFEKLHDGDEAEIRRRHSQHFLEFAGRSHIELRGRNQLDWLNRLDEEQGNIRLALEWCLVADPESALKLVANMDRYWIMRGRLEEAIGWIDRALETPAGETEARTDALLTRARLRWLQGDYPGASRADTRSTSSPGCSRARFSCDTRSFNPPDSPPSVSTSSQRMKFSRGRMPSLLATC